MKQIAILLMTLMFIPAAMAHAGAPGPAHETRLIHDDNDDSLLYAAQLQGVIDNIAVDAREGYSFVFGEPLLIFKLMLNGACSTEIPEVGEAPKLTPCETVVERIQFTAGGASHELVVETADEGATWTGDVDYLMQPVETGDGARYVIEVGVRFSSIGVVAGDSITDIFVKSEAGGTDGDSMPQGLTPEAPEVWVPVDYARFNIGSYEVRAPDYYAELTLDEEIGMPELEPDEMITRVLTINNPTEVDQDYTVITTGMHGLHAFINDGSGGAAASFALQAGTSRGVEIAAHNMAGESAMSNWTVLVASSLGGLNTITSMVHMEAPECQAEEEHGDHGDHGEAMEASTEEMSESEHGEHEPDQCGPDHTMEEHEETPEHHEDGHEHEGHEDQEKEETPFLGTLGLIAAIGAAFVARRK